jgi:hypothetical protein
MTTATMPLRFVGDIKANTDYHHGQLRPAVGVQSYQVLRANRSHPELAEAYGWTYNHAPMLAYWGGRFFLEYLSNPIGEHMAPGQTLLTSSVDGRTWEKPRVVFPPYVVPDGIYPDDRPYRLAPGTYSVMHQRMGFYVAPDGRLLVSGFYGICPHYKTSPQDGRGIGRVVREVYAGGSLGPIYFVRYNRHAGWAEHNTRHPFFTASPDKGFIEACEALLDDKLVTLQWWEEDRAQDGFFAVAGYQALSYYHAADGRVVGLWKHSYAAITGDDGESWSDVVRVPSLVMSGAKIWGQRTSDGRFALVYNPSTHGYHRWPLAVATGDDGYVFDDLLCVVGEVPRRRFAGNCKDFGAQYVRGIVEGNGSPPDGDLWVAYSMNKEDIWVSRIPVPVHGRVTQAVSETFDGMEPGGCVVDWNIYSPLWAPVSVVHLAEHGRSVLELRDQDPYDYAKAERVFPESSRVTIETRVMACCPGSGRLFVAVADGRGQTAVRLWFDRDGRIYALDGCLTRDLGSYEVGQWCDVAIMLDTEQHLYDLTISGVKSEKLTFDASVSSIERVMFCTGSERREPTPYTPREEYGDVENPDDPVDCAVYYVDCLNTRDHVMV